MIAVERNRHYLACGMSSSMVSFSYEDAGDAEPCHHCIRESVHADSVSSLTLL